MTKQSYEIRSYANSGNGGYLVVGHVALDKEVFANGTLPTILVLPDGTTAYKYLNHYNVEDGYFVSTSDMETTV